ncbi:MAG: Uma2 family endonuclease [Planctomycetes bacterium]|nr:Uma2 family endonuclease [Planctomycetota bacterium]
MSTAISGAAFTTDELQSLADEERFELVDGRIVERHMGSESGWTSGRLFLRLGGYVDGQNLGWVWPADTGYRCFPDDPNKVRKPDVSFVARGRLPHGRPAPGYEEIAPDLAAESVSPKDRYYDVEDKVEDYLRAGVRLVWVINPEMRTVTVYRPDGSTSRLHEDDELSGEDVIPGFTCRVGDLFLPVAN